METNVTIISTNLNNNILDKYKDYYVINNNFKYEELLKNKKVLFFNVLNNVKKDDLDHLFKFIKEKDIKYINVTNNLETSLYSSYLIIYDNDIIAIEGNTLDVLENEKLIKRIGLQLPFMIELSNYLKDYGLINKTYLDKEKLVNELWK